MITKPRIIGLLTILVVALLILRSGDEPCDSGNRSDNAASAAERRPQPRISGSPTPGHEHGTAGRSGAQNTPPPYGRVSQQPLSRREGVATAPLPARREPAPHLSPVAPAAPLLAPPAIGAGQALSAARGLGERGWGEGVKGRRSVPFATPSYGRRGFYPEQPYYPDLDDGSYGSLDPYGKRNRMHTDGYRFRPSAEQGHRQAPAPDRRQDPYAMPQNPPSRYQSSLPEQPRPPSPAPYPSQPAYADHPWEVYNFRPLEKSPGARGRWQGPYGQPDRHLDPYSPDPWSPSPSPQWGSTPPAQRMYPSLSQDPGRRLTAL